MELLIKVDDKGLMSQHLAALAPDGLLDVSGPHGGYDWDLRSKKRIGMICGGTGISPMLQIIREVLWRQSHTDWPDPPQMFLLYAANELEDFVYHVRRIPRSQ